MVIHAMHLSTGWPLFAENSDLLSTRKLLHIIMSHIGWPLFAENSALVTSQNARISQTQYHYSFLN